MALKEVYLIFATLWTLMIAFLCLVSFRVLPSVKLAGADKGVHFVFHFMFTALWFLYFERKNPTTKNLGIKIFLVSFFYGGTIEIAQELFTTTRSADILDLLTNTAGSMTAIIALRFINYRI